MNVPSQSRIITLKEWEFEGKKNKFWNKENLEASRPG